MTKMTRKLDVMQDDDFCTSLKIAFASTDRVHVDQHFGSAKSFSIYAVNPDTHHLITVSEFGDLEQDGNEDKLLVKFQLLEGCAAVYCRACGASAVRQLMTIGIQPVKVSEGALIDDLIATIQQELKDGPSSWLAKAMTRNRPVDGGRFDDMEQEGWVE
ncbi:MAG: NifB/NifX family molybdenum-iron cluster-binding protein [Pseudomonadales bacterium]|nr:NifB/NifX family molybdenum-iron cluster-binding protein [Pseudomonadales bacterium]